MRSIQGCWRNRLTSLKAVLYGLWKNLLFKRRFTLTGKGKTSCPSSSRARKRVVGSTGWSAFYQSTRGLWSESTSTYMDDEEVIWNSQHGFVTLSLCLTDMMTFYNQSTGSVDKGRNSRFVWLQQGFWHYLLCCRQLTRSLGAWVIKWVQ